MTQEQLAALKGNMQRELDFLDRKTRTLKSSAQRDAPLSDSMLAGVTYGRSGMGGSYGGMPRARQSMLDGVWDYRSDVETELDTGSEATDLLDSRLCVGVAPLDPPQFAADGDISSRGAADAPPEAGKHGAAVDLRDDSDSAMQEA